ncbi:pyridoxamine 5'-phosphate oxidase family protein [Streptomyces sp. NPDC026589]|uniref:pyridoxamine 5'-phosphate oxidase family protein n=1 Tax=Streptomyces sp. NPDC026589 TaxID=3155609 RepID=UPI0033C75B98
MPDRTQQEPPRVSEAELENMTDRTVRLLDRARYLNLATVSPEGRPWVATLEYAWLGDPLRLLFGSATGSRHSRSIATSPGISGSLFVAGGAAGLDVAAVDGAQFTGVCSEVAATDLETYHSVFYETVFPDKRERAQWMLPPSSLRAPAEHRLYLVEVDRWWLIDTRTWEQDRVDRRAELPAVAFGRAPHLTPGPRVRRRPESSRR